ncbi:MAG: hypothetical protein IJI22_03890 [Bacilli bacterium]|nr:hypothetical protein [Bacilli bacterium]
MNNRFGFAKYEVLTVIVLIMSLSCFLLYGVFKNRDSKKFDTFMNSAIVFCNTVRANEATFHNSGVVYLGEVLDEKLMSEIRSPFSSKYCDNSESKVELINDVPHVTLKCDNYIIEKARFNDKENAKIYKIGGWSSKKNSSDDEEKTLYNCIIDGKELFDDYYEELYFISRINKKFGTDYYYASNIKDECKVKHKKFYRTKEICE